MSDFNASAAIKMVMAPSERMYIEQSDTGQLAELSSGSQYLPRVSGMLAVQEYKSSKPLLEKGIYFCLIVDFVTLYED